MTKLETGFAHLAMLEPLSGAYSRAVLCRHIIQSTPSNFSSGRMLKEMSAALSMNLARVSWINFHLDSAMCASTGQPQLRAMYPRGWENQLRSLQMVKLALLPCLCPASNAKM